MKYKWILFDADETLFHFDNFQGMKHMMKDYGIDFTQADFEQYQRVNKPLWVQYQNGKIGAKELQTQRFSEWAKKLGTDELSLNSAFLNAMAEICEPIEGAKNLLEYLQEQQVNIGIITNGFEQLQEIRLNKTNFGQYIDILVISELVGFAKPDQRIFEFALSKMGQVTAEQILMVGDTLESDILGGNQMQFDTCWLNAKDRLNDSEIKPTIEVTHLDQLREWLTQH
ncbi:pyrimidine 5'-nucleotidase [Marinomonas epiphytica]